MRCLRLTRSCASSLTTPYLTSRSWCYPTTSAFVFLSLFLWYHYHPLAHIFFPSSQYCPYPFSLRSCTFVHFSHTFAVPLILSFLILSSLVTPLIHLNILISATSNLMPANCCFPKTVRRTIAALKPNRAALIKQANRAGYRAGCCSWGHMVTVVPELLSPRQWILGNILDNSQLSNRRQRDTTFPATLPMQLQERFQRAVQMSESSTPVQGARLPQRTLGA